MKRIADINICNKYGWTFLELASREYRLDVVKYQDRLDVAKYWIEQGTELKICDEDEKGLSTHLQSIIDFLRKHLNFSKIFSFNSVIH